MPPVSGLAADERLRVPIDLDMDHKPLQDLLDALSRKTGVRLTLDTPLAREVPRFSSYSFRNVPAHQVMDGIAYYSVVDGRWEKTDEGYGLHAVRAVDPGRTERSETLSLTARIILTVGSLLFLLTLGIYCVISRFRNKRGDAASASGHS